MSFVLQPSEIKNATEHISIKIPLPEFIFEETCETLWDRVIRICDQCFARASDQYRR